MVPPAARQQCFSFGGGGPNMVRVGFGFTVFVLVFGASVAASDDKPDNSLPKAARDILASADKLEVLSIEVARNKETEDFHGFHVLGTATITDKELTRKLAEEIESAVTESTVYDVGFNYNPRYGLRATSGGKVVEMVICFHCTQIEVYAEGKLAKKCATKRTPQKLLNQILSDAKIPVPPTPRERK
jgi:hypothetical protein